MFQFEFDCSEEDFRLDDGEQLKEICSKPLDSNIPRSRWHRLALDAEIPKYTRIEVWICSSETEIKWNYDEVPLIFDQDRRESFIQVPPGRYVASRIRLRRLMRLDPNDQKVSSPLLRHVEIEPGGSWLDYLPAVYKEDESSALFMEKFLSAFEAGMAQMEGTISRLPNYFDPLAAPKDFVPWLAKWLSLDLYELLGERNREYILKAAELYEKKGTKKGLEELVKFLTGKECRIKEYMNNVFRSYGREHTEILEVSGSVGGIGKYRHQCRKVSKTLEANPNVISKMGSFEDEVFYTLDTSDTGRISPEVIGLFIFLRPGESLQIDKEKLEEIIEAFLPINVRVQISASELPFEEVYARSCLGEMYEDMVNDFRSEAAAPPLGGYCTEVSWKLIYSYEKAKQTTTDVEREQPVGNSRDYRNYHSQITFPGRRKGKFRV